MTDANPRDRDAIQRGDVSCQVRFCPFDLQQPDSGYRSTRVEEETQRDPEEKHAKCLVFAEQYIESSLYSRLLKR